MAFLPYIQRQSVIEFGTFKHNLKGMSRMLNLTPLNRKVRSLSAFSI